MRASSARTHARISGCLFIASDLLPRGARPGRSASSLAVWKASRTVARPVSKTFSSALALANQEATTLLWFTLRLGPSTNRSSFDAGCCRPLAIGIPDPKSGRSSRATPNVEQICRTMSISSKLVRRPNETPIGAGSYKETDDAGDGVRMDQDRITELINKSEITSIVNS